MNHFEFAKKLQALRRNTDTDQDLADIYVEMINEFVGSLKHTEEIARINAILFSAVWDLSKLKSTEFKIEPLDHIATLFF